MTRTGGTDGEVSVSFATANGTATAGSDYTNAAGIVTFPSGDADPRFFLVPILDDALDEPDETFTATLTNPTGGATLAAPTTHTVTITDNDAPAAVSDVPALDTTGLAVLAALLALAGLVIVGRRF